MNIIPGNRGQPLQEITLIAIINPLLKLQRNAQEKNNCRYYSNNMEMNEIALNIQIRVLNFVGYEIKLSWFLTLLVMGKSVFRVSDQVYMPYLTISHYEIKSHRIWPI